MPTFFQPITYPNKMGSLIFTNLNQTSGRCQKSFLLFNLNTGLNLGWIIPKHLGDIYTD
jgi:hypothetical protein